MRSNTAGHGRLPAEISVSPMMNTNAHALDSIRTRIHVTHKHKHAHRMTHADVRMQHIEEKREERRGRRVEKKKEGKKGETGKGKEIVVEIEVALLLQVSSKTLIRRNFRCTHSFGTLLRHGVLFI